MSNTIQGFQPTDKIIMQIILKATGKQVSAVELNVRTFGPGAGVVNLLALNPESTITIEGIDITSIYRLGHDTKVAAMERKLHSS